MILKQTPQGNLLRWSWETLAKPVKCPKEKKLLEVKGETSPSSHKEKDQFLDAII